MNRRATLSIGGQIALVVVSCAALGLVLGAWIVDTLLARNRLRREHVAASVTMKDAQRLNESCERFLVTAELIVLDGDQRLGSTCIEQARTALSILEELRHVGAGNAYQRSMNELEHDLLRVCSNAEQAAGGARVSKSEHVRASGAVRTTARQLRRTLLDAERASSAALDEKDVEVERVFALSLATYVTLMGAVWWLARRSIVRPLRSVRDAAAGGAVRADADDIIGPREVGQLWDALRRFAEAQQRNQRDLERANRVKDRFVANMSHELRTPLNGVVGYLDLLAAGESDPERSQMLEAATSSAQHLMAVIGDILDYSKFQTDQVELDRAVIDPNQLGLEVCRILRWAGHDRGNELQLTIDRRVPPRIYGDPLRLRQVLLNLVGNAIKFTSNGTVRIEIGRRGDLDDDDDCQIRFCVRDTGCGMPESVVGKLFEPFVQADASTTRTHGGTGLGLSICKLLVERMGGSIRVQSAVGVGTEISFVVPLQAADEALAPDTLAPAGGASARRKLPPRRPRRPTGDADRLRILLVEDNAVNQRVTRAMLERAGHLVDVVDCGLDAIEHCGLNSYDTVLMDTQMPEMDGPETTRRIRSAEAEEPGRPRIPIIALTANTGAEDRRECLDAGADAFLSKPVRMAQLLDTIRNVANER